MSFRGQHFIVTGAAFGIGQAVATSLAGAGASVTVVGRRNGDTVATVDSILRGEGRAFACVADVRDEPAVGAMVSSAVEAFGPLHGVICCAGVEAESAPIAELTEADYLRIFDVHVKGTFFTLKHTLPLIVKAGGGAAVVTASTGGLVAFPGAALYCAAKHAVVGLAKVAALEYAARGVRVNAVAPSAVDTPMLQKFTRGRPELVEQLARAHPMGRIASVQEVAASFVWLASQAASYITGQTLTVDGGYITG